MLLDSCWCVLGVLSACLSVHSEGTLHVSDHEHRHCRIGCYYYSAQGWLIDSGSINTALK